MGAQRKRHGTDDDVVATQALVHAGVAVGRLLDGATRRAASLTLSQYQVLAILLAADPAPLEPRELATATASGSAHVTMLLDQLERGGALKRRPHATDRRRRTVVLTDSGRSRARAAREAVAVVSRAVLERMGPGNDPVAIRGVAEAIAQAAGAVSGSSVMDLGEADPGRMPPG